MAGNYKYSGARIAVASASGAISSGDLCAQEGFAGIALVDIASGGTGMMAIEGVWNIVVPASTVKGDFLYMTGANGVLTDAVDATSLTRTGSNAVTPVAIAVTDRAADTTADVLLLAPGAYKAALQV